LPTVLARALLEQAEAAHAGGRRSRSGHRLHEPVIGNAGAASSAPPADAGAQDAVAADVVTGERRHLEPSWP
jgi:hypothetical protein